MENRRLWVFLLCSVLVSAASVAVAQDEAADDISDESTDDELVQEIEDPVVSADDVGESDDTEASADSDYEPPDDGIYGEAALQLRLNPLGLSVVGGAVYRWQLSDSDSLILKGTHLDIGLAGRVSPAFARGGPYIEIVPLAFFKVRATLMPAFYFGNFGFLAPFDNLEADWSPPVLEAIDDADGGVSASGLWAIVEATLQLRLGPVAAIYENSWRWNFIDMDTPFYEPLYDMLLAPDDFNWRQMALAGYIIGPDPANAYVLVGPRYDWITTREGDFTRQRIGGIAIAQLPKSWASWSPRITFLLQTYFDDPWVEGELMFGMEVKFVF